MKSVIHEPEIISAAAQFVSGYTELVESALSMSNKKRLTTGKGAHYRSRYKSETGG